MSFEDTQQQRIERVERDEKLSKESKEKLIKTINAMYINNEKTTIEKEQLTVKEQRENSTIGHYKKAAETEKEQNEIRIIRDYKKEELTREKREDSNKLTALQLAVLMEGIYISGVHPLPKLIKPYVTFKGGKYLTAKNLSLVVADAGGGKSSVFESILASMHNEDCDSLGFKVSDEVTTALFFDCEQDFSTVEDNTKRMKRRAKGVIDKNKVTHIIGLREVFTIENKQKKIIALVDYYKPQLLLLDGVADLVYQANSEEETVKLYSWLIELITKYNLSIISSIHPNSQSTATSTIKARGHIGSEMIRRSEGVIQLVKSSCKTITTISTNKMRHSEPLKASFTWGEKEGYNVSCEPLTTGKAKSLSIYHSLTVEELNALRDSYLEGKNEFKCNELEKELKNYINENHPQLNGGMNAVATLRLQLMENNYILKTGITPLTIYSFSKAKGF